ncbi:MAG: FKBP-type peptidyl-prolyl cis-trans isomerase, partial [Nanoarchaeota archaeon]
MEISENDFVKVEYDMYANGKLVQTTDEKKGKAENLPAEKYEPVTMIVGKGFLLKALDEDIKKNKAPEKETTLELSVSDAFGPRKREFIRTFPKSAFDEQKLRAVVGMTYDFNGMLGTVKSVSGGRVMVDFNSPFAGKDIKLTYKVAEKIEKIETKVKVVMNSVLRVPEEAYKVSVKDKILELGVHQQLLPLKELVEKTLQDFIPESKDYA